MNLRVHGQGLSEIVARGSWGSVSRVSRLLVMVRVWVWGSRLKVWDGLGSRDITFVYYEVLRLGACGTRGRHNT